MSDKRYEDAPDHIIEMIDNLRDNDFGYLNTANIKVVIDTKIRKSKGKVTLGRMKKANAFERFLTESGSSDGYDFIMFLDGMAIKLLEEIDIKRIISHELQHCGINDKDEWTIRDHEITDFYDEIEKNQDDPRWNERAASVVGVAYEQEKQENKKK